MCIASFFYSRNYQNSVLSTTLNCCLMVLIKIQYFGTKKIRTFNQKQKEKVVASTHTLITKCGEFLLFLHPKPQSTACANRHLSDWTRGVRPAMLFFCTKHSTVDTARLAVNGLCHLGQLPGNLCMLRTHPSRLELVTLSQSVTRPVRNAAWETGFLVYLVSSVMMMMRLKTA